MKTPSGIYCQNRQKGRDPPPMPLSFILSGLKISTSNELNEMESPTNRIRVYNLNLLKLCELVIFQVLYLNI